MRNIKYIILFLLTIICVGCSYQYASTTRDIRHSGFTIYSQKFTCNSIFTEKEIYDPIKFYVGNYMITKTGNIYETSLGKVYSNEMNCKRPDFDIKVTAILDLSIIRGIDNKYYYLSGNNEALRYTLVTESDKEYYLYNLLLGDKEVLKVQTINSNSGIYYVLRNDGNVYEYRIINNNNSYIIDSISIIYNKNTYGSKIIDFNYNGSSSTTFIKTELSYYRMKVMNSSECYNYVDIACQYEMVLDSELQSNYNKILAYNGSNLVTSYGLIFNVNN